VKPMPSRTRQSRLPLPSLLALLGAGGLVASGLGALPGAPAWVWLVVLVAGASLPHLRAFARDTARRTDDLRAAREALDNAGILFRLRTEEWERRLEGIITPEESRRLRADFNAMLIDFAKLRGEVEVVAKEQRVREMGESFMGVEP
jgi:nucleotide-binding universal stress UspA family protein